MFIACRHCRELVAPHPLTRQLPPTCPRCGGHLPSTSAAAAVAADTTTGGGSDAAVAPSLVTLLRPAHANEPSSLADPVGDIDIDTSAARERASAGEAEIVTPVPPVADVDAPAQPQATDIPGTDAATPAARLSKLALADPSAMDATAPTEPASGKPLDLAPSTAPAADATRATGHPQSPSFLQRRRIAHPAPSSARWQWGVIIALVTILVLQVLLADRERLAANAGWRPLIGGLCGVLGCSMPAWREPQALTMIDRDVRPLPETPGVLLAKATFRNDARWAQPWPVVLLTLKDADGRSVGARALAPADYLDASAEMHIAPGQTAEITVNVREPSASVVAFAFDFH